MSSTVSSASQALEAYITDFEKTSSHISDYYSLPPSLERKDRQTENDGKRKLKKSEKSDRVGSSSNNKSPSSTRRIAEKSYKLNGSNVDDGPLSPDINGHSPSKTVEAEKLLRLCDALYNDAISSWKAERKIEGKPVRNEKKMRSKKSSNSKSKSPNYFSQTHNSTSKTAARTSPPKDFFAHYADCVTQMQLDVGKKKTFNDGNRPPPSWIEGLSSIVGEREPNGGRIAWPIEDRGSDMTTSRSADVQRLSPSSTRRPPPSWIGNISLPSGRTVVNPDDDNDRVYNEQTRPPRAPSWVDKVYEDRMSTLSKSIHPPASLHPSKTKQENQLPYRDMLHHLFQQQDVRLRRLKLGKQIKLSNRKSEKLPRSVRTVGKNHYRRASYSKQDTVNRKEVERERTKLVEDEDDDDNDEDDDEDVDEMNTDILLTTSAYGRSKRVENHSTKIPSTPNTNDAEIVSARFVDVKFEDAVDQPEDHLESELAGDRSWEKMPNGPQAQDGVLKDIMDKRSVEKLKNLLLATQSQVAQREKENLKLIQNGIKSHKSHSSSPTKGTKSMLMDSNASPIANGKNRLLKSLSTAKESQIAFSSALNETIAAHSSSSPTFLPPQHHSTPVKHTISTRYGSARVLEDQPQEQKPEDPILSSSTSLVEEDVVIGKEDSTDADETAEEEKVHLPTSSSSKADGKVVVESTKALEMAFQHFNHLQTLFQEMSLKMTTEKQGVDGVEGDETDIVSSIV